MLVKFRNGYFITFSTHKIEWDRAGAQELSEDAENSWAWLRTAKINPIKPHSSGLGQRQAFQGGGEAGAGPALKHGTPRSKTSLHNKDGRFIVKDEMCHFCSPRCPHKVFVWQARLGSGLLQSLPCGCWLLWDQLCADYRSIISLLGINSVSLFPLQ